MMSIDNMAPNGLMLQVLPIPTKQQLFESIESLKKILLNFWTEFRNSGYSEVCVVRDETWGLLRIVICTVEFCTSYFDLKNYKGIIQKLRG